jgi:hypothetical protein
MTWPITRQFCVPALKEGVHPHPGEVASEMGRCRNGRKRSQDLFLEIEREDSSRRLTPTMTYEIKEVESIGQVRISLRW